MFNGLLARNDANVKRRAVWKGGGRGCVDKEMGAFLLSLPSAWSHSHTHTRTSITFALFHHGTAALDAL